jgi:hypothetical protein
MRLDDFIMLGRTEPAESKKYGVAVCSAGYSRELRQFVRIYPLPFPNNIRKWSRCTIPLRRPRDDNRLESWRIDVPSDSAEEAMRAVEVHGRMEKDAEFDWLKQNAAKSIAELNARRASLGIIDPKSLSWRFDRREDVDPAEQGVLFDRIVHDGPTFRSDLIARLQFLDADGWHTLTLKEWGCTEWLRKSREQAHCLWDNLKFTDNDYEHLLFVGNQNNQRTSWLVISTISRVKKRTRDLFAESAHA